MPREDGGGGADLLTVLRTIEAVSAADGSTGWCVAMGVNTFRHSAQFPAHVRRELFASDPVGVSAGSATPRGVALAVPGGYRVTGPLAVRQRLHARVLPARGLPRPRRRRPAPAPHGEQEVRIAYFYPKTVAEIVDTWAVSGMRGTGSHDVVVDDLFVPEERTFSAAERRAQGHGAGEQHPRLRPRRLRLRLRRAGRGPGGDRRPDRARRAKTPRFATTLLRERPHGPGAGGRGGGGAARRAGLPVRGGRRDGQDAAAGRRSRSPSGPELRLAMTHAAQGAARATHLMSVAAGTTSIFTASPLERYARDAEVVTRHVQLQVPELRGGGAHPPGPGVDQPPVLIARRPGDGFARERREPRAWTRREADALCAGTGGQAGRPEEHALSRAPPLRAAPGGRKALTSTAAPGPPGRRPHGVPG